MIHKLVTAKSPILSAFLGIFAKLRKASVSFIMSVFVCPFVCMEQPNSHFVAFHEIGYLSISRTSIEKIEVSLKSDKSIGYFTCRCVYIYDSILLNSFIEWEMFQTEGVEKIETHFLGQ